ncbi:MAG: YciI family protein [Alphaproteobacteria bacterium]|nr:YciI family protein [Alphaproteobacteria bacterium]MBU1514836.1 YciI family protein [Alphaproteobacteria bacterium]MBU2093757.1 YciI family protein [Alphaproteobacteria bacterium]MBU2149378.1 YciI family protein [Alphaproteobacteria bacterium]MBU2305338.1 YciI family protein [Alphaproteobacteria bacterium]
MPLFVLHCLDKPDSLPLRMATREAHLAYVGGRVAEIKVGGPMLNANGDMAGSLLILDVADLAAAEAFSADDPYTKAGLWERVSVKALKATLGQL